MHYKFEKHTDKGPVQMIMVSGYLKGENLEVRDVQSNGKDLKVLSNKLFIPVKTGKDTAEFYNLVLWDKTAENFAKVAKFDTFVEVVGRLQEREYEVDGEKRISKEIVVDYFDFHYYYRTKAAEDAAAGDVSEPTTDKKSDAKAEKPADADVEAEEEELPF